MCPMLITVARVDDTTVNGLIKLMARRPDKRLRALNMQLWTQGL